MMCLMINPTVVSSMVFNGDDYSAQLVFHNATKGSLRVEISDVNAGGVA